MKRFTMPLLLVALFLGEAAFLGIFWLLNEDAEAAKHKAASNPTTAAMVSAAGKEIELSDFDTRNYSFPDTPIQVKGLVVAVVPTGQADSAEKLFKIKKAKIDQAILAVINSADYREFEQPEFTTLKNRMRRAIDQACGDKHQQIDDLIFPNFSVTGN